VTLKKPSRLLFVAVSLFFLQCAAIITTEEPTEQWNEHPQLVLSLSEALVNGIRILMDELLISESWFRDMDVSIFANQKELLRARIIDFDLQDTLPTAVQARWRITHSSRDEYEYVTTDTFAVRSNLTTPLPMDSIVLKISESTSSVNATNGSLPETIHLIYWRDISTRDKVASLRMSIRGGKQYSRKY